MAAFASTADALALHPPYRVPLSHFKVVLHHAKLAESLSPQALNGAVVAFTAPASQASADEHAGVESDEAPPSLCLAVGIVRSIDAGKGLAYVLTPVPLEVLKQATSIEVSIHCFFRLCITCSCL